MYYLSIYLSAIYLSTNINSESMIQSEQAEVWSSVILNRKVAKVYVDNVAGAHCVHPSLHTEHAKHKAAAKA